MNPKDYLSPEELERYIRVMKRKNPNFNINNSPGLEAIQEREERLIRLGKKLRLI